MSFPSSKRQRGDEEAAVYNGDFMREKKKHRPLPLRSSPRSSQRLNVAEPIPRIPPPTLTSVESPEDEPGFSKRSRTDATKAHRFQGNPLTSGSDFDTSMDIDSWDDSEPMDKDNTSPSPDKIFDGNRRPLSSATYKEPPQSPNTCHGATSHPASQRSTNLPTIIPHTGGIPGPASESSRSGLWWHSSRLPSQASDNGDGMASSKTAPGDTAMEYDISSPVFHPPLHSPTMEAEAAAMRERLSSLDLPDQDSTEPTSRAKAVKKLAFSMGYRADCDKCRRKVPGHYNHIMKA
ncbi:uncharacterized protein BJX67DRAFT_367776 [Aspergillus lucknowensis]|uniref:Uncharacterized protein n=1 Tax=Aspergillus lucknowensis TaxID=176173 RepID=A0ABR4L920_9EURO